MIDDFRDDVLEKAHLSKERMCLTVENLQTPSNFIGISSAIDSNHANDSKLDAGV